MRLGMEHLYSVLAIACWAIVCVVLYYRERVAAVKRRYDDGRRFYTIDAGMLCGGHYTGYHARFDESYGVVRIFTTCMFYQTARRYLGDDFACVLGRPR